ncbi:hypothetical protein B0H13DRAFT_1850358 [Mycena leptocephala]|nr:hypothetical protein B0H13DRAFT_1850358 [Mycena leptocephala]
MNTTLESSYRSGASHAVRAVGFYSICAHDEILNIKNADVRRRLRSSSATPHNARHGGGWFELVANLPRRLNLQLETVRRRSSTTALASRLCYHYAYWYGPLIRVKSTRQRRLLFQDQGALAAAVTMSALVNNCIVLSLLGRESRLGGFRGSASTTIVSSSIYVVLNLNRILLLIFVVNIPASRTSAQFDSMTLFWYVLAYSVSNANFTFASGPSNGNDESNRLKYVFIGISGTLVRRTTTECLRALLEYPEALGCSALGTTTECLTLGWSAWWPGKHD